MNRNEDITWIKQVLAGNINVFGNIINRHKDKAFNLAYRICGNREDAEEVLQDSFLKAFRSLGEFRMDSSFSTWFYKIVYNTSITAVRSGKGLNILSENSLAENLKFSVLNNFEYRSDEEYRKILLNYALGKLSDEERGLISLFYYEELTIAEISEITGENTAGIKVKLHRTRKKMLGTLTSVNIREAIYK